MTLLPIACRICQEPTKVKPGTPRGTYQMCPSCFRERIADERREEAERRAYHEGTFMGHGSTEDGS